MQLVSALIDGSAKLTTADDTRTTPEASAPVATTAASTPRARGEWLRRKTRRNESYRSWRPLWKRRPRETAPTRPPPAKPASRRLRRAAAALRAGGAKPAIRARR